MEAILNIEDRLNIIKGLFMIMVEAHVFNPHIYIDTTFQKWEVDSKFREECLSLSLTNPIHKMTILTIVKLADEIIALAKRTESFDDVKRDGFVYSLTCKPIRNQMEYFQLIKRDFNSENENEFEFIVGEYFEGKYIVGKWWPYNRELDPKNRKEYQEKLHQNRIHVFPPDLFYFAFDVSQFIKDRVLLKTTVQNHNELTTKYNVEQLGNLFDSLNTEKARIDIERRADFIELFMDANLNNWKVIVWYSSNPELATLIFKLTGIEPKPTLVNKYFDPKSDYDSHSHSGKRKENHAITMIVKKSIV